MSSPDTPAPRFFGLPERGIAPGAAVYIKGATGATGGKGDKGDKGDEGDPAAALAALARRVDALDANPADLRNFATLKDAFLQLVAILQQSAT
jgi:hypothetical protein